MSITPKVAPPQATSDDETRAFDDQPDDSQADDPIEQVEDNQEFEPPAGLRPAGQSALNFAKTKAAAPPPAKAPPAGMGPPPPPLKAPPPGNGPPAALAKASDGNDPPLPKVKSGKNKAPTKNKQPPTGKEAPAKRKKSVAAGFVSVFAPAPKNSTDATNDPDPAKASAQPPAKASAPPPAKAQPPAVPSEPSSEIVVVEESAAASETRDISKARRFADLVRLDSLPQDFKDEFKALETQNGGKNSRDDYTKFVNAAFTKVGPGRGTLALATTCPKIAQEAYRKKVLSDKQKSIGVIYEIMRNQCGGQESFDSALRSGRCYEGPDGLYYTRSREISVDDLKVQKDGLLWHGITNEQGFDAELQAIEEEINRFNGDFPAPASMASPPSVSGLFIGLGIAPPNILAHLL